MTRFNITAKPPNPPWKQLDIRENSGGYISYFYNDDMSRLPVRAITKIGDNKADPNLETQTYGLFSYCNKKMRKSIVKNGCKYIYFITNRNSLRVLTGVYNIKWYAPIPTNEDDFCLTADSMWFVQNPIPLTSVDKACGTNVSRWFRTYLHVNANECKKLNRLLKYRPNDTNLYFAEIDRLERFNLKFGGYRYISAMLIDSYSWDCDKVESILGIATERS